MTDAVRRLLRDMNSHDNNAGDKHLMKQRTDLRLVRELNRLVVLNCVREHGPIARVMVARRTGLSRTTVSSIMDALLQEGFVREGSFSSASREGGRRAILVHFNADVGYVIGVNIERSRLTLLLTDLSASIIAQQSEPFELARGPEICLPLLVAEVRAFVASAAVSWDRIIGIGLGIPGPLDAQRHKLSGPPGMPGWDGVDVWQALQQEFQVPLYIDNDANMGALGESRYGACRGSSHFAYVFIGTGIGAGLILNGEIYRGHGGSAGELGHITLDENGPLCVCGNHGCLETLASTRAIVADAQHNRSFAHPDVHDAHAAVTEAPEPIGQVKVDIDDVIKRALDGDVFCIAAIERAGEHIGIALASLINLFNPSAIIIDSSVARAGELLFAPLHRAAAASSLPAAWHGTRILPSELYGNAIALGAVSTVIDAAFSV